MSTTSRKQTLLAVKLVLLVVLLVFHIIIQTLQNDLSGNVSLALEMCTRTLTPEQQLTQLFSNASKFPVEADFLQLACRAMHHLKKHGMSNLIYQLHVSRCAGTMRSDGSDSLLPVKCMPTGLIEYMVKFFNAEAVTKVTGIIMYNNYISYVQI